jgi:hypothetical protein
MIFAKQPSRSSGPDQKVAPFAFRQSTAHDEEMGESCERCGRPGKPCSVQDPTISGMWKILTLCDQCHGAIRQMDVRACKWFRRYCAPRNRATPIFKTITRVPKPASTGRPVNGLHGQRMVKPHHAAANLLRRIRAAVDTYFIYRRMLRASRSTSLRFALKRLALGAPAVHLLQSH